MIAKHIVNVCMHVAEIGKKARRGQGKNRKNDVSSIKISVKQHC